ncbi:hypothetical protein [Kitasatospora sp. NBC_01266]|uniref:hypothetical protein n=1 Tax=Kitasatospora sp. NBC_01266 TaxID=2903572 RepID=UPI002E34D076|nr:hypothetical protein [Kitasatospora sp. NBC_01266]
MHIVSSRTRVGKTFLAACGISALLASAAAAGPNAAATQRSSDGGGPGRVITLTTAKVGAPGNPSVAVLPFEDAVYPTCADAPPSPKQCATLGSVAYPYQIGQLEITVEQYVDFLNTVDPEGLNQHALWNPIESSAAWPKYGQIDLAPGAGRGAHYTVAFPEWADKPYAFADFLKEARFVNSLSNGRLISRTDSTSGSFGYTSYRIELSPRTEQGMYDLDQHAPTRTRDNGFVVPSQDEWVKAAYYDPTGGGTLSYWKYPTNPGVFGDGDATAPNATVLNPTTGDVTNQGQQPLANYTPANGSAPTWCPGQIPTDVCNTANPLGLDPTEYAKRYQGVVATVGQTRTPSPWGTFDQGGNTVEWTDTITPGPTGGDSALVWRRLHGGVSNSPAYQMWLSATGLTPQGNTFFNGYPWFGMRIGIIGDLNPCAH